ncbi:MAG: PfkB family carbohydrate kinase [bacterium]|nr:PfkB family carbohydrate kinase [bacterium]
MTLPVVVAGHLCLDLLPEMRTLSPAALTSPGRLFEVGALATATGGAVSNTGLALDRLGVEVRLVSKVGDDLTGGLIRAILERANPRLVAGIGTAPGVASSYTVVLSPHGQDRIFLHYGGTNLTFDADSVDMAQVEGAAVFHLGYPPILPALLADDGAPLRTIYQRARALGAVTSLDTSHPDPDGASGRANWRAILSGTLPYVDLFIPSIDEILFMLRRADYDRWHGATLRYLTRAYLRDLADELIGMGAAVSGFKLGEMGVYLKVSDDPARLRVLSRLPVAVEAWCGAEVYHPAFEVEVVGTTGAGDCCYAGLIASLLHGFPPQAAARMANAVGACNVEGPDALSGVRTWAATLARIEAGWPLKPVRLPDERSSSLRLDGESFSR